jgi:hypothetical protein
MSPKRGSPTEVARAPRRLRPASSRAVARAARSSTHLSPPSPGPPARQGLRGFLTSARLPGRPSCTGDRQLHPWRLSKSGSSGRISPERKPRPQSGPGPGRNARTAHAADRSPPAAGWPRTSPRRSARARAPAICVPRRLGAHHRASTSSSNSSAAAPPARRARAQPACASPRGSQPAPGGLGQRLGAVSNAPKLGGEGRVPVASRSAATRGGARSPPYFGVPRQHRRPGGRVRCMVSCPRLAIIRRKWVSARGC